MKKSNIIAVWTDNGNKHFWCELNERCNKFRTEKYNNNCKNYTKEELIELCNDLIEKTVKLQCIIDSNEDYYDTQLNTYLNIINNLTNKNKELKEDKFFNKFFIYRLYIKISNFFNKTVSKNESFGY